MTYPVLFLALVAGGIVVLNMRLVHPAVTNAMNAWLLSTVWAVSIVALSITHAVRYSSDMWLYLGQLHAASNASLGQFTAGADRDVGFYALVWVVAHVGASDMAFRGLLVGAVAAGCLFAALRLFDDRGKSLLVFFVSTINPVFFAYTTNTVRQGVAIAMIVGVAAAVATRGEAESGKRGNRIWLWALIGAPLIHLSALVPAILILLITLRWPKIRTAFAIWSVGVLLYSTGLNRAVMGPVAGLTTRSNGYLQEFAGSSSYYSGGVNRTDFLAVSILILLAGALLRLRTAPADRFVPDRLLIIMFALNAYFLYFGFITYSDRLAAYSWFLAPFVLGAYALAPSASKFAAMATIVGALGITILAGFPLLSTGATP